MDYPERIKKDIVKDRGTNPRRRKKEEGNESLLFCRRTPLREQKKIEDTGRQFGSKVKKARIYF